MYFICTCMDVNPAGIVFVLADTNTLQALFGDPQNLSRKMKHLNYKSTEFEIIEV